MLNHFKFYNALFNAVALLLMAAGLIAGPILENSTLVACLAAMGSVHKVKVDMSRFAFTTYSKALIELRTFVRGIPFDFTPPLPKRCVQENHRHFVYQQVDAQCYVNECHRPLMSKNYWVEKDKKVNPHSPTSCTHTHGPQKKKTKKKNKKTSW